MENNYLNEEQIETIESELASHDLSPESSDYEDRLRDLKEKLTESCKIIREEIDYYEAQKIKAEERYRRIVDDIITIDREINKEKIKTLHKI